MDMPLTEASILRISSSRWASSDCSNLVYAIFVSIELKVIVVNLADKRYNPICGLLLTGLKLYARSRASLSSQLDSSPFLLWRRHADRASSRHARHPEHAPSTSCPARLRHDGHLPEKCPLPSVRRNRPSPEAHGVQLPGTEQGLDDSRDSNNVWV